MTNETQQTPVEKLFHKLWDTPKDKFTWYALLKEAKEMEKEQLINARLTLDRSNNMWDAQIALELAQSWYNETYGGNK